MSLSEEERAFLRKRGWSEIEIDKDELNRLIFAPKEAEALSSELGDGKHYVETDGQTLSTYTYNGLTIERIRLPQGIFRRVIKNGQVVSFTNLSESKKRLK